MRIISGRRDHVNRFEEEPAMRPVTGGFRAGPGMSAWRIDFATASWLLGFVFFVSTETLWILLRHT